MQKVLILTEKPFKACVVSKLTELAEESGVEIVTREGPDAANLDGLEDIEGCIIRSDKFGSEQLEKLPKLKCVVRAGSGYDNIDVPIMVQNKISVGYTPGENKRAVTEMILAEWITALRNDFNGTVGYEVSEKVVGIAGFGAVGRDLAELLQPFKCTIKFYDPFFNGETCATKVDSLKELAQGTDMLSLNLPGCPETVNCISSDVLNSLNLNATVINSARANVVNLDDMKSWLVSNPNSKYISDIPLGSEIDTAAYPNYKEHALKCGAQTMEANSKAARAALISCIDCFLKGDVTKHVPI